MAELVDALVLGTNSASCEGSSPFSPTKKIMKVTIENKKGLEKDLKVFIDKKTISGFMDEKYEEIRKDVVIKGFRPGKVPTEILKRQFGKAVYGEVIDKLLKDTTTKALEENKIKPAGQPKIDLKSFGEGKDLEYIISVTELPEVSAKGLSSIKVDEYVVKIDPKETDKRISDIAKNQNNFKDSEANYSSKINDLVIFDYKGTIDGKEFKGNEGKNTQLVLGKDLFIKGFDKQLEGVKSGDTKNVEVNLPENFPEKELINKSAVFECKVTAVRIPEEVKIKLSDDRATQYPYLYLTGHGNIKLNENEVIALRSILLDGAFLHVDDNYGLDKPFRREIKKVFPNKELIELPKDHEIFNSYFSFPNGLPKIHEHDKKPPQAFALFEKKRMILLYTYESDLGDGWEDPSVHQDPWVIRESALKMGVNIIYFALSQ